MLLNTRDFALSALSLSAAVEYRRWVRERALADLRHRLELFGDLLDPSEKRNTIAAALAAIDNGQAERALSDTAEGKQMLVWLSLLPTSPGLTLEQAGALVPRFAINRDVLDAKLDGANGLGDYDPPPAPDKPTAVPPAPQPQTSPEDRRKSVFESMCKNNGVTAKDLVDIPVGAAAAMYMRETGAADVDNHKLKAHLYQWAQSIGALDTPTVTPAPKMDELKAELDSRSSPPCPDEPPAELLAMVGELNHHKGKSIEQINAEHPPAAE